jgi:integrase
MSTKTPRRTKANAKQDETHQWPFIRWIESRQRWMVDSRTATGGERKFYQTKNEAEGAAIIARTKRQNEGASAFDHEELARYGWTIQRAIKFALQHLKTQKASVPLTDAVKALIESKRAAGRAEDYLQNRLTNNLGKLTTALPDRTIASVGMTDIEAFLTKLPVAIGTKNTIRTDCVTLWSYAIKAGWAKENEAQKVDVLADDLDAVEVLTPDEAESLMRAADGDVAVYYALGLFAGLRTDEIETIDWQHIKLDEGHIEVTAATAKRTKKRSRARRLVPITPNLHAWLSTVEEKNRKGTIQGPNFRRRELDVRNAAGFGPAAKALEKEGMKLKDWPRNVMRHSFVSYRLADTQNTAKTALESGHREQVLFDHYREVVTPKAAKAYFAIMPLPKSRKRKQ